LEGAKRALTPAWKKEKGRTEEEGDAGSDGKKRE